MKIKGYTLHGDYYLSDKVITNTNWKKAHEMEEEVTLPNGKKVIAHTLSKEELETIPIKEREIDSKWYWTSTPIDDNYACYVHDGGDFNEFRVSHSSNYGGIRLGFKNPF